MEKVERKWAPWVALALVGAVLLFWWDSTLLWPVKIVVVLFHELGHAVATWLTGGQVLEIGLNPSQGGHTLSQGGVRILILNAGYLGSLVAGIGLMMATRSAKAARVVAWLLPVALLASALFLVRPLLSFGFLFTLFIAGLFAALARYGATDLVRWVLRGLGVFSVLYAVFDVRDDVFRGAGQSDAHMLAEITFLPAPVWGLLWLGLGIGALYLLRKRIA